METARTATGGQASDELAALGRLPSEAELRALIERYAGSQRVTCELADELLAALGEASPVAQRAVQSVTAQLDAQRVAREVEEVAGGSWLDKIGGVGSSAPPRARSVTPQPGAASSSSAGASATAASTAPERARRSSVPPALTITPVPPQPDAVLDVMSVEHGLEHLPAATYSSVPPPNALLSQEAAPIALPLSSRPPLLSQPPSAAESDSPSVEQWGTAPPAAATPARARTSSRVPPLPGSLRPGAAATQEARSSSVPPLPDSVRPEIPEPALSQQHARTSSRVPPLLSSMKPGAAASDAPPPSVPARSPGSLAPEPASRRTGAPAAAERSVEEAFLSAEEDALLDQWSDDLDRALPSDPAGQADALSMSSTSDVAPAADEPEPWNAPDLGVSPEQPATEGGESVAALEAVERSQDPDDAPLSAAELSLLDRWSTDSDAQGSGSTPAAPAKPESAITGGFVPADYAAAVYAPSDSRAPRARSRSQQPAASGLPDTRVSARPGPLSVPAPARGRASRMPASASRLSAPPAALSARWSAPAPSSATATSRPPVPAAAIAASQRPAAAAAHSRDAIAAAELEQADDADMEVALEDEIELDPDDLIEIDSE